MRSTTAKLLFVASSFCLASGVNTRAEPITAAFTYQGQLKEGGVPANGEYDFVFKLFDAPSGPAQVGSNVPVNAWTVSNGLFAVELDFGTDTFNGQARWLEIAVGSPGGSLTILSPRQPVTATPYAAQTRGLFVDDTLNVGIGTGTPGARLDVGAGDIHLDANRALHFADNGRITSHDDKHSLLFRRNENKLELREYGEIIFSAGATAGDETGSVVVKSSGDVGIGTLDPLTRQHIEGSDLSLSAAAFMNEDLAIEDADAVLGLYSGIGGDWGSALSLGEVDAGGNLVDKWTLARRASNSPGGSALRLTYGPDANYAANPTIIHLAPSGNVGIGTDAPAASLHVDGGVRARGGPPGSQGGDNNGYTFYSSGDNDSGMFSTGDGQVEFYTNAQERMRIDPSGRVGIGTTNPDATLDLNGEMIHRGGALKHLGHDLIIADPARGDGGRALVHTGDGTNERLEINFANDFNQGTMVHGNLGIGGAPSARLDVADGDIKVDMDMRLKFDAEDGRMFELGYDSAADTGIITAAGRNLELNTGWGQQLTLRAGHGGVRFNIQTDAGNDATKMELTSAGDLEVSGDLVVSGAVRGNIGPNNGSPFPRPAFDSGWLPFSLGESRTLEHNIGGNVDNYVVDLQFKDIGVPNYGVNIFGIGGIVYPTDPGSSRRGAAWYELTSTEIAIVRYPSGLENDEIRVRIWVYN